MVDRTWMWGPDGFTAEMTEPYRESPGGERIVQYFDKSRMEDNGYRASEPWNVTNGLLVVELVTGKKQIGDNDFVQYNPAAINVAGDADDPLGVQYATLAALLDAPPLAAGDAITHRLDRSGTITDDPTLKQFGVTASYRVSEPGIDHQVASPFWAFINSTGTVSEDGNYVDAPMFLSPFYATGYPITEAYWASVKVGGVLQDVLLQCFERRCLTYTPGNAPGWQVEAGNVGQHYFTWRYEQVPGDPTPTAPPDTTVEPTPTAPPATGTAEPSPSATVEPSPSPTPEPDPTITPTGEPIPSYSYAGEFGEAFDQNSIFDRLSGIGVGPDGSVYVLEYGTNRVQQYTPDGQFIRMWGEPGSGAGQFDHPRAVAFDRQGDIYIADWRNDRIQVFDSSGNYRKQVGSYGHDDGEFSTVYGVAFDSQGYLYAAETNNHRIQKFEANGNFVEAWGVGSSLVGGGSSKPGQFAWPLGIAIDENDIIYVVDSGNFRIQKLDTQGNYLGEWGSKGGGNGQFENPSGIAISKSGIVYVADYGNHRIQAFRTDGTFRGRWGSNGSDPGQFIYPESVGVGRDGSIYVVDGTNSRVQSFSANGSFLDSWVGAHRGRFDRNASALALDESGNIYVGDAGRVQKFDPAGKFIWEFSEFGGTTDIELPSVIVASEDGYLYVADSDLETIVKLTQDGEFVDEWSGFDDVSGLALDGDGNLWALEFRARRLRKISTNGGVIGTWNMDGILSAPFDVAIDGDKLFIVDADIATLKGAPGDAAEVPAVKVFDLFDRGFLGVLGEPGQFEIPVGVGIDSDGHIHVSDIGSNSVQMFAPDGSYLATIGGPGSGNGRFNTPTAVQVAEDGTLYVLDTFNQRVQIFK